MTAARDKGIGVLSIIKRVVGERARKTNPICRCTDTAEEVDHPEGASIVYVSEDGRDVDVTLFPSWLEGTTSKPVEKSWIGLLCSCFPVRTLLAGRYWKEGRNGREEDGGGEGGGVSNGRRGRWVRRGSSCVLEAL